MSLNLIKQSTFAMPSRMIRKDSLAAGKPRVYVRGNCPGGGGGIHSNSKDGSIKIVMKFGPC